MTSTRDRGRKFEKLAADLIEKKGYHVFRPPRTRFQSGDFMGWLDILGVKDKDVRGHWYWRDYLGDLFLAQVKARQNFSWKEMKEKAGQFPETIRLTLFIWDNQEKGFKTFVWLPNSRSFQVLDRRLL